MTSTVIEKKKYTYADYLNTPEDQRYELLEGELIKTPSPVTKHQRISRKIEFALEKHVSDRNLGEVFDAPFDVYLDNENVVEPDLLFVSKERADIITDKNIQGAPDLVIEILSESSAYRDLVQKKKLYAKFGVRGYWIVDPYQETVEVHELRGSAYVLSRAYGKGDVLESGCLKDISIELNRIF